jgi:sirohydrochlorin ferrochelatase
MKNTFIFALTLAVGLLVSCSNTATKETNENGKKVGILLVNHGSNSENWRNMLLDLDRSVRDSILGNAKVGDVKTAFMEYTEPSIATRMKEFDKEGYDEVVVVPIFLTVSSHYSHDIPVIVGLSADPKIVERLDKEKIEVYRPKAKVTIVPPLDYTTILKKNVERRVMALSKDAANEGVLLVAYGDEKYNQQWEEMVDEIGKYLKVKTGHESIAYSWCGHLVRYSTQPTKDGIAKLQELEDNVIVIPVLVANDSYFQKDIIQVAVDESANSSSVFYIQDAILPDVDLNKWVIDISNKTVEAI